MEIEVKVLEIDPTEVRRRLRQAGCHFVRREMQTNYMYDYPDSRLFKADGSYVRLRAVADLDSGASSVLLTFKQTISRERFKTAREIESLVSDREAMHEFLQELGLINVRIDEKIRETYHQGAIHFEIDHWAGIPPYLEIEATSEKDVKSGLEMLGYTLEDATSMNLKEVLDLYGIQATHLRFSQQQRQALQTECEDSNHG